MLGLPRILYYKLRLDRNLHRDRQQILALRQSKFRRLIKYAFKNSSFYHRFYSDHGLSYRDLSEVELSELPVINKQIMMDNFDELVIPGDITRNRVEEFLENSPSPETRLDDKYQVIHSSGSTGRVGYYIYDQQAWDFIKAISLRMFSHFGLKPVTYAFIGAADGHYAGVSLFLSPVNTVEEFFYGDYLVMDISRPLVDYIQPLNELKPGVLSGYASGIRLLTALQRENNLSINPAVVICGGEPLTPETREVIKSTWDCRLVNYYAASESLMLGVEREEHQGMYLFDDANYIEFREDDYLLTNLYNYTQPLIRYQMNDVLTPLEAGGKWPFSRVAEVIGRQEDMLWFVNKQGEYDFIHPIVIVEFYVKGLDKYQLCRVDDYSFIFRAVVSPGAIESRVVRQIDRRLQEILSGKNMLNLNYRIEVVEDIERDPDSGKFRLIIMD
ncbi:MAG: phenylacetate--CoA ligase family protein [Bacillota bacterium]